MPIRRMALLRDETTPAIGPTRGWRLVLIRLNDLRSRVALLCVVLIAILVIGLQTLIGRRAADHLAVEIGTGLAEVAQLAADRFDREMLSRSHEIRLAARGMARVDRRDEARIAVMVSGMQSSFNTILWLAYIDTDGRIVAASGRGRQAGERLNDEDIRRMRAAGSRPVVFDTGRRLSMPGNPPGPHMVTVAAPALTPDGRMRGALVGHIGWRWAEDVQRDYGRALRRDRPLDIVVANGDRRVIIGPDALIGQAVPAASVEPATIARNGWVATSWPDRPDRQLTGYAALVGRADMGELGWTVHVRLPAGVAMAPVQDLRRMVMIWGLGGGLLVAIAGWLVAGWIARPLRRIAQAADRIRSGEDAVDIPNVRGATEVELLSYSLRALIDRLTHSRNALDAAVSAAARDALTGLPNRRFFDDVLDLLCARLRDEGNVLGCVFIDLDGFKAVNDTLGHAMGDRVLSATAARLREAVRDTDVPIRLGGDEFVVLLTLDSGDPAGQAARTAERLIALLSMPVPLEDGVLARIGASAGVGLWPLDDRDPRVVLGHADAALYQAKRAGRGRVRVHGGVASAP
ncbi:diguanylate cyclase [Tistrella bauzanensis]|uniref:GGDEF domain-containing protein n=1 Tax=Tistrella TaxID=171436 RepID=UPI0031F696DF